MMRFYKTTSFLLAFLIILTVFNGCKSEEGTKPSDEPTNTSSFTSGRESETGTGSTDKPTNRPVTTNSPNDTINTSVAILFIGNSFTHTGDVPGQLEELAGMYGVKIDCYSICPGGATLRQTKDEAIEEMKENKYDYAVFQDDGPIIGSNDFSNVTKELCDTAKSNGIIPVLYNPAYLNNEQKPDEERQDRETYFYEIAAENNEAILVNAGDAWVYAYKKLPDISLYKENDYHANDAGAYLTACVFASTLFNLHIKDIADFNIYSDDSAIELGQAAWEFVTYYKENGKSPDEIVSVLSGTNQIDNKAE